jgi:hypothetical protein
MQPPCHAYVCSHDTSTDHRVETRRRISKFPFSVHSRLVRHVGPDTVESTPASKLPQPFFGKHLSIKQPLTAHVPQPYLGRRAPSRRARHCALRLRGSLGQQKEEGGPSSFCCQRGHPGGTLGRRSGHF